MERERFFGGSGTVRIEGRSLVAAWVVEVEACRDSGGELQPTLIRLGGRSVDVSEVLDRWPGHDHTYLKLLGSDGATYILRHDSQRALWELVLFRDERAGEVDWSGLGLGPPV
jgi:hypothetical protein